MTEITHLADLNLMFMCFEPEPLPIPLTQDEKYEQDYRRMCLEDQQYEADRERHDMLAERMDDEDEERFEPEYEDGMRLAEQQLAEDDPLSDGRDDYDDRFDDDNRDAQRDADDWDREHEAGDWDWRNG